MKLYDHTGYKRLTFLIAIVGFIFMYIILVKYNRRAAELEVFIIFPIISALTALLIYALTRIIYWVVDGFRSEKEKVNSKT